MGYLAVMSVVFVVGLVINAMALGLLSQWLFGMVQDWVLLASLVVSGLGAWLLSERYEEWSRDRAYRR
jgi:hypothetical protein